MFKILAVVLLVAILGVLVYATTRPDNFRVERSTSIKAPSEKIHALINDFHQWGAWSPYEKIDPLMKRTFSGAPSGKGAVYEWAGEGKAGAGRMEIMDAPVPAKVDIQLDFSKPFAGHFAAQYTLKTQGESTEVTWAMFGPAAYISKVMGLFFNMDKMIGADFETGLANLKAVAEK